MTNLGRHVPLPSRLIAREASLELAPVLVTEAKRDSKNESSFESLIRPQMFRVDNYLVA